MGSLRTYSEDLDQVTSTQLQGNLVCSSRCCKWPFGKLHREYQGRIRDQRSKVRGTITYCCPARVLVPTYILENASHQRQTEFHRTPAFRVNKEFVSKTDVHEGVAHRCSSEIEILCTSLLCAQVTSDGAPLHFLEAW